MSRTADKRAAILKATLELIAGNGFHGTPTSMIASRAGVGVGSIYRYFKDKDELIHELHAELEEKLKKFIREGYSEGIPIRERFIHIATKMFRHLIKNPEEFKFLEQYYNSPFGVAKRRERLFAEKSTNVQRDLLKDLFETGKAQQVIKDFPLPVLYALTFGPVTTLAKDHISGFFVLDEATIPGTIEACWDALKR